MECSSRNIFFALLEAGLWGTELPEVQLTPEQWKEVHDMANRQAVTVLVYDAVKRLPAGTGLPQSLAAMWLVESKAAERRYDLMTKVIDKQKEVWEKNHIQGILQKGHEIAAMYPIPAHRSVGDIDWYFPVRADWKKANEIAQRNSDDFEIDSDGDAHYTLASVVVEHHKEGHYLRTPVDVIVMLVEHIFHHATVMGIGMKQFCDLEVAYKYYECKYDEADLQAALEREGLVKWNELVKKMIADPINAEGDVRTLVNLVLADGHFGLDKKNRYSGFHKRFWLMMKYAPKAFFRRWGRLVVGRMKRCFTK